MEEEMQIKMHRGDIKRIAFSVAQNNKAVEIEFDNIYFTVKKNCYYNSFLFQKQLANNTITYNKEDKKYHFIIEPEDTENLDYGTYDFDIKFVLNGVIKQTFLGKLYIQEQVTYKINE